MHLGLQREVEEVHDRHPQLASGTRNQHVQPLAASGHPTRWVAMTKRHVLLMVAFVSTKPTQITVALLDLDRIQGPPLFFVEMCRVPQPKRTIDFQVRCPHDARKCWLAPGAGLVLIAVGQVVVTHDGLLHGNEDLQPTSSDGG